MAQVLGKLRPRVITVGVGEPTNQIRSLWCKQVPLALDVHQGDPGGPGGCMPLLLMWEATSLHVLQHPGCLPDVLLQRPQPSLDHGGGPLIDGHLETSAPPLAGRTGSGCQHLMGL